MEYPRDPNEVIEGETHYAYIESRDGNRERITFEKLVGCVHLHHEHHNPETIMEYARRFGAVHEDKYIVVMGDGLPCLYTETELRDLLGP